MILIYSFLGKPNFQFSLNIVTNDYNKIIICQQHITDYTTHFSDYTTHFYVEYEICNMLMEYNSTMYVLYNLCKTIIVTIY